MGKLRGVPITIIESQKTGTNPFGEAVYEQTTRTIDNVLIYPLNAKERADTLSLTGKEISYRLSIPKGVEINWKNSIVRFYGETWQVVGDPLKTIDELTPLDWNERVEVARFVN